MNTRLPAQNVCVYCASSESCDPEYHKAAKRLGRVLAKQGWTVVYGGGAVGSMGALAEGALEESGHVIGVLPRFMDELEWGHSALTELHLVDDMRIRKDRMLALSSAVVALPGGSGTLDELLEVITLKRLGIYLHPIVLVNTRKFFDPLISLLDLAINEKFMDPRHRQMWQIVSQPEDVPRALSVAATWGPDARRFAAM